VCGGSLSLMDAGVPISAPVAGVAMGLIKEGDKFIVLTDILGDEDALGDMDFKIAGTAEGVTGVQMDIKITGLTTEIMRAAMKQAHEGRLHILDEMAKAIAEPRKELSRFAPQHAEVFVNPDIIRLIIGPGGKNIKAITAATGASVDIEDSGRVSIFAPTAEALEKAREMVSYYDQRPDLGKNYLAKVRKIMEIGAIVEVLPNVEALVHVSQLDINRVEQPGDVARLGEDMLNCAALPSELIESELFGWRKGAFTGAVQNRAGLFRQADKGTLFLDEIGDLSTTAQAKVLRALQEGEIQPLGDERRYKVDVRLVCATNRPLEELVEQGLFREDLYYRINVFPVFIPPLRERPEDILPLTEHFLGMFSKEYDRPVRRISTPAIDLLLQYHWPGNVRELKNVMERAVLICEDAVLRAHHLPSTLQSAESSSTGPTGGGLGFNETIARVEQEFIVDALKNARGNIHQAARDLGITYRIIYYKMKKYGIDHRRFAPSSPT
jgi:Polyribonucleotide nucleotidyltransferase (polynucleotide phosphorylase)